MFTRLKSFFGGKTAEPPAKPQNRQQTMAAPQPAAKSVPVQKAKASQPPPSSRPPTPAPAPARAAQPAAVAEAEPEDVSVSLQAVLDGLPGDLKRLVTRLDVRGATLTVGTHRILTQLPQGTVTLAFGELRQAAPQLFSCGAEYDSRDIALPLNEILSKINPKLVAQAKAAQAKQSAPAPASKTSQPAPIRVPVKQAAPEPPRESIRSVPAPAPTATPPPSTPVIAGTRQSASAPTTASGGDTITLTLSDVMDAWPETLRLEITQANLAGASVAAPVDLIEPAMRKGKVIFPWKTVRSWLDSNSSQTSSSHDNAMLEFPLEAVMPAFLQRQKQAPRQQQKLAVDNRIPDLFSGFGGSSDSSSETSPSRIDSTKAQPEANRVALNGASEAAAPTTNGRPATPDQIVQRAAAMNGVAGALVGLPDGLLVAGKLPPAMKGEMVAAFLPQMFAKVSHCMTELKMAEPDHLSFTSANVAWQIYRADRVFFAVFGKQGQTLPVAELQSLVRELSYQKK